MGQERQDTDEPKIDPDLEEPIVGVPGGVAQAGVSPEELMVLTEAGAVAVRLGSTVLRSSRAGPAALAVLSAASRWR